MPWDRHEGERITEGWGDRESFRGEEAHRSGGIQHCVAACEQSWKSTPSYTVHEESEGCRN